MDHANQKDNIRTTEAQEINKVSISYTFFLAQLNRKIYRCNILQKS